MAKSKGVKPITSDDLDRDLTVDAEGVETPLKQIVGYGQAEETPYKAPFGESENTYRESTQWFGESRDSCETPLKALVPSYFPGSEDRSIGTTGTSSASRPCVDAEKGSSSPSDPPPPYTSNVTPHQQKQIHVSYKNVLPVKPTQEHDIEINEHIDYPFEYTTQHYDVLIVNHPKDFHRAVNVKKILEKFCLLDEGQPIKVLVLGHEDDISINIGSRVQEMGEASDRSTMYFIIMSESFCEDEFYKMVKDECLWLSVTEDSKRWSVIPLRSRERNYKEPFGLGCLKGISLENDLVGDANLDDPKLFIDDLKLKRNNVKHMIKERIHYRKEREKKQDKAKREYTDRILHERRLKAIEEQGVHRRKQLAREKEAKEALEKAQQRAAEPLSPSEIKPEKVQEREPPLLGKPQASGYQVHVTQNNYIGMPPVGEIYEDSDEEFEIIRGDPPRN